MNLALRETEIYTKKLIRVIILRIARSSIEVGETERKRSKNLVHDISLGITDPSQIGLTESVKNSPSHRGLLHTSKYGWEPPCRHGPLSLEVSQATVRDQGSGYYAGASTWV